MNLYDTAPELAAVNFVLRKIGEQPVTGLDVPYPTVAIVRNALTAAKHELLVDGWYFNTFKDCALEPDLVSGTVPVPSGVLQAIPHSREYICTGAKIVRASDGHDIQHSVPCTVVRDMTIGELPRQALYVVQAAAALATYVQDFGMDETAQALQEEYLGAYHQLGMQHTQTRRSRLQDRNVWQRFARRLRY